MDNANVLDNITNLFSTEVVSSQSLILNLLVAFLLSLVVMFHYKKFSTILSNKESILSVIPFLILIEYISYFSLGHHSCAQPFW